MPRVARFKIAVIEDLLRQLEYAPAETRRRQMDAAESLVADIDPGQKYPLEFVSFRITGFRPEHVEQLVTFDGAALVGDLVNFVQLVSEKVELGPSRGEHVALRVDELARMWKVSSKTVQRYRGKGLVCHYVRFAPGGRKLACYADAAQRFAESNRDQLAKASGFTRVNGDIESQIVEEARELHEREYLTLNEAALRLSKQHDRAHETIRMMLRRHDRDEDVPIFSEAGPLSDRSMKVVYRAWRCGVEPALMAKRFKKTKPTIHRVVNRFRGSALRGLSLRFVDLPTFSLPDAAKVIVSAPAVAAVWKDNLQLSDAVAFIHGARESAAVDRNAEHALIAGYNFLKRRGAGAIGELGESPTSAVLDQIETDLRWAVVLQRKLILLAFPAALRRIEQHLRRPLEQQSADEITAMIRRAIEVTGQVVEELNPSSGRGQRLERVAGFAMERALAMMPERPAMSVRAAARHAPGSVILREPFAEVSKWAGWLELRRDLRPHIGGLEESMRRIITLRYGLAGEPPMTCAEAGARSGQTAERVMRMSQRAMRELCAMVRARKA